MSYRAPSRKLVASLSAAGCWLAEDVVLTGTDAHDGSMRILRSQAAVPASLIRRWIQVRDAQGAPRLEVVRAFVSGDGFLFTVKAQPAAARAPI